MTEQRLKEIEEKVSRGPMLYVGELLEEIRSLQAEINILRKKSAILTYQFDRISALVEEET